MYNKIKGKQNSEKRERSQGKITQFKQFTYMDGKEVSIQIIVL